MNLHLSQLNVAMAHRNYFRQNNLWILNWQHIQKLKITILGANWQLFRLERIAKCSYFILCTQNIKFFWFVMKIKKFLLPIWWYNRGLFPLGNEYFGVFVLNGLRRKPLIFQSSVTSLIWIQQFHELHPIQFSAYTLSVKRNLSVTSSKWHTLKSKALKWIIIGHRLAKILLTKHIWKCLRLLESKKNKIRQNRKRSCFKNHRNCSPPGHGARYGQ